MSQYYLEVDVPKLTPTLNTWQRLHWQARRKAIRLWRELIATEMLLSGQLRPRKPLPRWRLLVVRRTTASRTPDWDNAMGGLKPVLDALQQLGIVADDGPGSLVEQPAVRHVCVARRAQQGTTLVVESA